MAHRNFPDKPIGIVGAGLAGLCCAVRLREWEDPVVVFEAADQVGGRVRTDEFEGFKLDRGFQVFLTAYPEAQELLRYDDLRLGKFIPGADVRIGGRFERCYDPRKNLGGFLGAVARSVIGLGDAWKIARMEGKQIHPPPNGSTTPPTIELLRKRGISDKTIDRLFRPFFGGVFLDPDLTTPSSQFEFVFDMFAHGVAALPAEGMGEIPRQIADRLPQGTVRTGSPVVNVTENSITLLSGETIECSAVVVATDMETACELLPELDACDKGIGWRSCVTLYYDTPSSPVIEPILCLRGDEPLNESNPVNHMCVPSLAAPSYSPDGRHLVALSVIDDFGMDNDALEQACRAQMTRWFGRGVSQWRHLRTCRVRHALPKKFSRGGGIPRTRRVGSGVFLAGDWQCDPSINGAMRSGRQTAERVLQHLASRGRASARTAASSGA